MSKDVEPYLARWMRFPLGMLSVMVTAWLAFKFGPFLGFSRVEIFIAFIVATAIFAGVVVWFPSFFGWRDKDASTLHDKGEDKG